MTNGSRQVWNMNCARSPQPCWSPSSGPCSPGSMAQGAPGAPSAPGAPGAPHLCSMHFSVLRKTLRHVTVLWYTGAWSTISTYSRWVAEWPMFVGDLSLKAECGSHTPWHALAHASVETCGFPGFHAGHGLDLVLAVSCMSYRHAVKSSQAERKRRSSAWTKTETFLSSPTMGRRWLPDAACGCKFGNGSVDHASQPVQHCNCRNRTSKQHQT